MTELVPRMEVCWTNIRISHLWQQMTILTSTTFNGSIHLTYMGVWVAKAGYESSCSTFNTQLSLDLDFHEVSSLGVVASRLSSIYSTTYIIKSQISLARHDKTIGIETVYSKIREEHIQYSSVPSKTRLVGKRSIFPHSHQLSYPQPLSRY